VHLLNLDVEPVAVPVDRVVSLGLIVTQLVTTAMKNPAPTVAVGFCADGEDHYLLSITDAAKAVGGDEAGRSTGLGARLLTALTRQLGGEMSTSEDGAVRIRLPVDALA
jgi:two-component sensor histidine kinase